jgi:hypothetical protein
MRKAATAVVKAPQGSLKKISASSANVNSRLAIHSQHRAEQSQMNRQTPTTMDSVSVIGNNKILNNNRISKPPFYSSEGVSPSGFFGCRTLMSGSGEDIYISSVSCCAFCKSAMASVCEVNSFFYHRCVSGIADTSFFLGWLMLPCFKEVLQVGKNTLFQTVFQPCVVAFAGATQS